MSAPEPLRTDPAVLPKLVAVGLLLATATVVNAPAPARGDDENNHLLGVVGKGRAKVFATAFDDGIVIVPNDSLYSPAVRPTYVGFIDHDRDGAKDLVLAPGAGTAPPTVSVFGLDGTPIDAFDAFQPTWNGGVGLGYGNVSGNRKLELFAFTPTLFAQVNFFGPGDRQAGVMNPLPGFLGGIKVLADQYASGGKDELVILPGPGQPGIRVLTAKGNDVLGGPFQPFGSTFVGGFEGTTMQLDDTGKRGLVLTGINDFTTEIAVYQWVAEPGTRRVGAFELVRTFKPRLGKRGFVLAAGDLDGDGVDELVVGSRQKRKKSIKIFRADGKLLAKLAPFSKKTALTSIALAPTGSNATYRRR